MDISLFVSGSYTIWYNGIAIMTVHNCLPSVTDGDLVLYGSTRDIDGAPDTYNAVKAAFHRGGWDGITRF